MGNGVAQALNNSGDGASTIFTITRGATTANVTLPNAFTVAGVVTQINNALSAAGITDVKAKSENYEVANIRIVIESTEVGTGSQFTVTPSVGFETVFQNVKARHVGDFIKKVDLKQSDATSWTRGAK